MKDNSDPRSLPVPQYPDEIKFAERLLRIAAVTTLASSAAQGAGYKQVEVIPPSVVKGIVTIASNAWKAKSRLVDSSGEVRDDMKRLYRNIEGILEALTEMTVEIKDRCGETFDYGLPDQVVATEIQEGLTKDKIIETIKPTIYWNGQIVQRGEVIIATPPHDKPSSPATSPTTSKP
jgi:hypothetical protein